MPYFVALFRFGSVFCPKQKVRPRSERAYKRDGRLPQADCDGPEQGEGACTRRCGGGSGMGGAVKKRHLALKTPAAIYLGLRTPPNKEGFSASSSHLLFLLFFFSVSPSVLDSLPLRPPSSSSPGSGRGASPLHLSRASSSSANFSISRVRIVNSPPGLGCSPPFHARSVELCRTLFFSFFLLLFLWQTSFFFLFFFYGRSYYAVYVRRPKISSWRKKRAYIVLASRRLVHAAWRRCGLLLRRLYRCVRLRHEQRALRMCTVH